MSYSHLTVMRDSSGTRLNNTTVECRELIRAPGSTSNSIMERSRSLGRLFPYPPVALAQPLRQHALLPCLMHKTARRACPYRRLGSDSSGNGMGHPLWTN